MRKALLSLLLCATVGSLSLHAQQTFRYGVTAGVDVTSLKWKQELISTDQSVGYTAGAVAEVIFSSFGVGMDFGLLYTQRGATINFGEREVWSSEGYGSERAYLHYLEIPINIRYKYTDLGGLEDYVAPFVYGGVELSFLLAHSHVEPIKYANEMGLSVGVGGEFWKHWQLSGGYTWGMTYALKTKHLTNFSARNRTWVVKLAYFF